MSNDTAQIIIFLCTVGQVIAMGIAVYYARRAYHATCEARETMEVWWENRHREVERIPVVMASPTCPIHMYRTLGCEYCDGPS